MTNFVRVVSDLITKISLFMMKPELNRMETPSRKSFIVVIFVRNRNTSPFFPFYSPNELSHNDRSRISLGLDYVIYLMDYKNEWCVNPILVFVFTTGFITGYGYKFCLICCDGRTLKSSTGFDKQQFTKLQENFLFHGVSFSFILYKIKTTLFSWQGKIVTMFHKKFETLTV